MPTLYIIAGPNGVGKTTSSFYLVPINTPIINSDEIAKQARSAGIISVNTQEYANEEAKRLINEQLESRNSLSIESNLADENTWRFLLEIKQRGYNIHLIYISTDSLDVLNSRIVERTLLGGHYVRPDIVKQRYETSLRLLNHYFLKPDRLQLFDNSKTMILMAEFENGETVYVANALPNWIQGYLHKHLIQESEISKSIKEMSIEEVRAAYQRMKMENKNVDS